MWITNVVLRFLGVFDEHPLQLLTNRVSCRRELIDELFRSLELVDRLDRFQAPKILRQRSLESGHRKVRYSLLR